MNHVNHATYRCALVAMTFATVCASVDVGLTWNTGNESFPSIKPRVDRMTEIKCVHVLCSRWSDDDRVRSYYCKYLHQVSEASTNLDVRRRDIPNDIELIVYDGQRRDPFIIHELESLAKRFVTTISVRSIAPGRGKLT